MAYVIIQFVKFLIIVLLNVHTFKVFYKVCIYAMKFKSFDHNSEIKLSQL
jgi:hypothetical protein